ncbi:MAG TPA: efflux RND transporter permease subunit [Rhizomicrobium sp.]|jgi:hydrophobic/amphiphilic exporter-1 (mainly G- bacteria), HAE1 family|nr:efflux RND transporter permease subunit [Rhizomicrobium sp.]
MNISKVFIERPVFTTLLMAALVIFGLFGYSTLPVSELPAVDFPTIFVSASLPGADPSTMASAVATPLESQFSSIPGVSSMTSQSSLGRTGIVIQFDLDRNIDGAAEDVLAAIQQATRQLPVNMPSPPTLHKVNPSDAPIFFAAIQSDSMPLYKLDQYAENLLARRLSTLNGVAQVNVFGAAAFAVRLQIDPTALSSRNIGIDQVAQAVKDANVDANTGQLNGPTQSTLIHVNGQMADAAHWNKQIIAFRNGAPVRIQDIGKAIDSYQNIYSASYFNGKRAIVLNVQRQPGSNTIQIVNEINQVLPGFIETMPKSAHLTVFYDRSQTIRNAVNDVQLTLVIAGVLVIGVIFVFLRTLSATIIPSLALPIAVIGTFAAMALQGFSMDNLSLMALTLSVGFVVDDAIVMLENIVRHVEEGEEPRAAAFKGSAEIGFTILSMTVSLAAVFIPIVFMGGMIGRLLHEFAVVIISAILISGLISVTLTPMLCSRFIKRAKDSSHGKFYWAAERGFERIHQGYGRSLKWAMEHSYFTLGLFALSIFVSVFMFMTIKTDFIPSEDTGQINVNTEAADRTSFEQMGQYQKQLQDIAMADPNIQDVMSTVGGGGARSGTNTGNMLFKLKPRSERDLSADQIIQEIRPKLARVMGVNAFMQNPPVIRVGGGNSKSLYQYVLQSTDMDLLQQNAAKLTKFLQRAPGLADVTNDMDFTSPSVEVKIDRDQAAIHGVSIQAIETALGAAFGGEQISVIYASDAEYWVMLELSPQYQHDINDLGLLYVSSSGVNGSSGSGGVPSANGTTAGTGSTGTANINPVVPLTAVTTLSPGTQALAVNHLGQLPAVTISFNLMNGYSLSDAVTAIDQARDAIDMPDTVTGQFQGQALAFQQSMGNMGVLLVIAVITVYLILGILYESFIHPLTILSGLPSAATGALIALWLFGMPLSLYAFVGMIMLIGIVKKNAIMMIDFAVHRERRDKAAPSKAIYEAAMVRFRPIMMTTMAAFMGTMPVAVGVGAGSEARQPLGLAVAGGLFLSQALTLYITPVIYVYMSRFGHWIENYSPGRARSPRAHGGHGHPAPAE